MITMLDFHWKLNETIVRWRKVQPKHRIESENS